MIHERSSSGDQKLQEEGLSEVPMIHFEAPDSRPNSQLGNGKLTAFNSNQQEHEKYTTFQNNYNYKCDLRKDSVKEQSHLN